VIKSVIHKEGYVVAYLTAMLYIFTFLVELGRSVSFKYSPVYIDMSATLLSISAAEALFLLLSLYISHRFMLFFMSSRFGFLKWLFWAALALCPAYVFFAISSTVGFVYPYKGTVVVIYITSYFIIYFREHFLKIINSQDFLNSLIERFKSSFDAWNKKSAFILLNVFVLLGAFCTGYAASKKRDEFGMFNKNGDYAIIAQYSDKIIAKKVIKNRFSEGYYVFKIDALDSVEFKTIKIER
jgi:hypothetical protein